MKQKSFVLLLLLAVITVVCLPGRAVTAAADPLADIYQLDQELLKLSQTLDFFQEVATKKNNEPLAKQIGEEASVLFEQAKALHQIKEAPGQTERAAKQAAVENQLSVQKTPLAELVETYNEKADAYWEQLMPELSAARMGKNSAKQAKLHAAAVNATATAAAVLDPFEPNDDVGSAYPITRGNMYNSKLSWKQDTDIYRYDSGAQSGQATVTLYVPDDVNYDLVVIEAPNKAIGTSMKPTLGQDEIITFQIEPNKTYYFSVFSMDRHFSETAEYTLLLSDVKAVLALNQPVDISLPAGEVPAYRFTAPVTGNYRLYTSPYGGFGPLFDTVLLVSRDEKLQQVVRINDEATPGALFSEINTPLEAGVTYFVWVSSYDKQKGVHARLTAALDTKATVASPVLHEAAANDGSLAEQQVVTISNGILTSDAASAVSVSNVPAGLTPVVTRNSNSMLTIQFAGKAATHESKHSVQNLFVTIPKAKVAGMDADVVVGPFAIEFSDTEPFFMNAPKDVNLGAGAKKIVKFTPPSSGSFELYTSFYGDNPAEGTSNTQLAIYEDYAGTRLIAANDDGDQPPFSKVRLSMQKGQDYYVVLSAAGNGAVHARLAARYLGVEYIYNAKGQLVQIKQNGKVLAEYTYDGNGNLTRKLIHQ
ncbi:RHS repeat protein [Brevibacillus parabrevis]|uniref:RHS repeat protein n=1 Tax=Brevibacillus parabrevis TaxID=54914 RepID=UPI001F619450|nr:RHS repeat protein [Brevibacillus parabrevis]MDR5000188.1 RHS repeat protein [Brevibacillus parabrevis]